MRDIITNRPTEASGTYISSSNLDTEILQISASYSALKRLSGTLGLFGKPVSFKSICPHKTTPQWYGQVGLQYCSMLAGYAYAICRDVVQ